MTTASVISPNMTSPLEVQHARRRFLEDSVASQSIYGSRPSMTIDELETTKLQNQQDEFVCIIGCISGTLVFLAFLVGAFILLSRETVEQTTVAEPERGTGGSGADTTTIVIAPDKSVRPGSSTVSSTVVPDTEDIEISSTTTPVTQHTETTETTETIVTTEWDAMETTETYGYKEKPKIIRSPLLCTVSVHFTETSLLPGDGECDIIFYESFYVKNRPSDWQDSGLDHFLKLGRTMHETSVGASFSPVGGQLFVDVTTRALFEGLNRLSNLGVKHYGMMNVYGDFAIDGDKLAQCLTVLRRIVNHIKSMMPDTVVRTALGVQFSHHYSFLSIDKFRKVFRPTYYIAITHMSIPRSADSNCWVFPMSMMNTTGALQDQELVNGTTSIVQALDNLTWLKQRNRANMLLYISFSMRAQQYTPEHISNDTVEASFSLFDPCTDSPDDQNHGDVHPRQVCSEEYGKYYRRDSEVDAEYAFDPIDNRTLTFDSEKGLKEKVCDAKAIYSNLNFSVAVYDVEYDQEDTTCLNLYIGQGSFRRVKALYYAISRRRYTVPLFDIRLDACLYPVYASLVTPCCPVS